MTGAFTYYKIYGTNTVTKIIKQEIKTNVIDKDTSAMTTDQLRAELECYYKSQPQLDIAQISKTDYLLTAALCERNWSRAVTMPQSYHKNIITASASIKSNLTPGAGLHYTRMMTGFFGLGGGFTLYRDTCFMLDISASISF